MLYIFLKLGFIRRSKQSLPISNTTKLFNNIDKHLVPLIMFSSEILSS